MSNLYDMDTTIWTPRLCGSMSYDFGVCLDWDFARAAIQAKVPKQRQRRLSVLASEELERLRIPWAIPYQFYENSYFVTGFDIGHGGKWLGVDYETIDRLVKGEEPGIIEFSSHNIDIPEEAYVLMMLFDRWVYYGDDILKKSQKVK